MVSSMSSLVSARDDLNPVIPGLTGNPGFSSFPQSPWERKLWRSAPPRVTRSVTNAFQRRALGREGKKCRVTSPPKAGVRPDTIRNYFFKLSTNDSTNCFIISLTVPVVSFLSFFIISFFWPNILSASSFLTLSCKSLGRFTRYGSIEANSSSILRLYRSTSLCLLAC